MVLGLQFMSHQHITIVLTIREDSCEGQKQVGIVDPVFFRCEDDGFGRLRGNDGDGDDDEKEPEPSFIRKYWYVFVPMALMSILAPPPPEEGQQQGLTKRAGETPMVGKRN